MKRITAIVGKIVLVILFIHVLGLGIIWIRNEMYLGSADETFVNYLLHNRKVIAQEDLNQPIGSTLLDKRALDSKVFLLGENHGLADVQKLDKQLLFYLHGTIGLKYYLAEMDSTRAKKLNHFLSGNQKNLSLLREVISEIGKRIPQQSSQELFQKWADIYDYNHQQPDSLKISVVGIDTDFDSDSGEDRDKAMFENFVHIIESRKLQNERFYGLFGLFHVLQAGVNTSNFQPFAARLKSSELAVNQVKSMVCFSLNSEVRLPKNDQYPAPSDEKLSLLNSDGPIVLIKGIKDLKQASDPHTVTFFDLNQSDSPYRKQPQLTEMKVNFLGGDIFPYSTTTTTNMFQYAVLFRNSAALTKLW